MTDLDTMIVMLDRAKIEFSRDVIPAKTQHAFHTELVIKRGYQGFVSCLYFNPEGTLVSIEAYE